MSVSATHRIEAKVGTTTDQVFDESLSDFDSVTPLWDGEVAQVSDFDATTDVDGDMTDNATGSHTSGNAIELEFDNATVAYGTINADAVNQTSGVISIWLNTNDVAVEVGKYLTLFTARDGGGNNTWFGRILNTAGDLYIQLRYVNDALVQAVSALSLIPSGWNNIKVMFDRSTGVGNDDGWMSLYINDVLITKDTGHDNDTIDWDYVRVGQAFTNSTSFGGSYLLDTIKVDPVGGPMLDTLAAQNGTYGMAIPVMDATARYGSFTGPTAETAVTAETNFDPDTLTMAANDEFTIIGGDVGADFYVNIKYSGGYKVNATAVLDAGTDSTADYSITDAPHTIRAVWVASSDAGNDDGYLSLYIDEVLQETLTGLDNDTKNVGNVEFGAVAGLDAGTFGIFYMDDCSWGPWVDITADQVGNATGRWGSMHDDYTSFIADSGEMRFPLNNTTGKYSPGFNEAFDWFKKGTPIRLQVSYSSKDYKRFYGTVDALDIRVLPIGGERVNVVVTDWLDYSATHPLLSPATQADKRSDEMTTTVVSDMPIAPQATDYATGSFTFPTAFDAVKANTKAYSEMAKIGASEIAPIYLIKDAVYGETLVLENAYTRNGLRTLDFTLDNTMSDLRLEYGRNVINRFENIAYPRSTAVSPSVLFSLSYPLLLDSGQTLEIRVNYADPSGGLPVIGSSMITPVITTDYLMNTESDGGGTNTTANLTIVATYYSTTIKYTLTNGDSSQGWITHLQARGYEVTEHNPVENAHEDSDSIDEYDYKKATLKQRYQQQIQHGSLYGAGIVEQEKLPRTKPTKVLFYPTRTSDLMTAWLTGDVGMVCRIIEDKTDTDVYAYIQGVEFTISPGGFVTCSWIIKSFLSLLLGLSLISAEFDAASTDAINYGYLPHVQADSVTNRTYKAEVYMHTAPAAGAGAASLYGIIGSMKVRGGSNLYIAGDGAGNFTLNFRDINYVTTGEVWESPVNPFSLNTWTTVSVDYEYFAGGDPVAYVDGAAVVMTSTGAPVGADTTEEGAEFVIGNMHAGSIANYDRAFDGLIKNAKAHDVRLTAAEHLAEAGGTDITRGLVFQSPCVRTSQLSDFEDKTLTAADKMIDNIYWMIGTPNGSVITRLIP